MIALRGYGRPFTRLDLELLPDDGRRQEIIDGVLVVTFTPGLRHQRVVGHLGGLLHDACPPEFEVLPGPFAIGLADDTELRPDLLVGSRAHFTEDELTGPPVLAVEVLSPSTRTIDLHVKRERFERAGAPSFWVVDPEEVRLIAWEMGSDGRYLQVADVNGEKVFDATLPYPVSVIPADLVR
jgi:Uma2 family endonuclease